MLHLAPSLQQTRCGSALCGALSQFLQMGLQLEEAIGSPQRCLDVSTARSIQAIRIHQATQKHAQKKIRPLSETCLGCFC